jgi:2-keto-3-deoxy-L-rhamnonate aldolase RhmA
METIRRIKANELTYGCWINLTDPAVTEMIANAGFDFIILDLEHGRLNEETCYKMILALGDTKCVAIARVADNSVALIKKSLEAGALGVMVPMINNRGEAERAVRAAKYSPEGNRGLDYGRGQGWGKKVPSYYLEANKFIMVSLIIETKDGVENIDQIVEVPGIDVILPGVYDLSGAYGVPGQFEHPQVLRAIEKIAAACKRKNIGLAGYATTKEGIQRKKDQGARFIELAVDTDLIWQGAERYLREAGAIR